MDGGGEWGGTAYDAGSGLLYVNANEMAWMVKLAERKRCPTAGRCRARRSTSVTARPCHRADLRGNRPSSPRSTASPARRNFDEVADIVHDGGGRMPGVRAAPRRRAARDRPVRAHGPLRDGRRRRARPRSTCRYTLDGYIRFTDPDGFPAVKPPWGTLTAIDMGRAAIAWQVPLGEVPGSGLKDTGSENYGGPVVTAGGLVFIGATNYDREFRAFDAASGTVLWETTLPAAGNATPAVYEVAAEAVRRHRRRRRQVGRPERRQLRRVRPALSRGPVPGLC